ncbi:MAG: M23 family metallopeptidase [Alphaproteobacteria bacterium]|nr:M23 family metallopeptidase [Alphaproteobacteria bacterium]
MGKRTRFRLIVVGFALAQGASEATAQLPFTAPGALREHGFVTHRDAPAPPLTREDSDPRSTLYHRGEPLSHAFLRTDGGATGGPLSPPDIDYEALTASLAPMMTMHGQLARGIDWLRRDGVEPGAGVTTHIFRAQGVVRGSLSGSLIAAGVSASATGEALRAFEQEIDVAGAARGGARFAALVERRFDAAGRRVGDDRIVWAELRSHDRRAVAIHRFRPEGGAERFWLADGLSVGKAPLKAPAAAALISSPFGKREGPILGMGSAMHTGVDYALPPGTPVPAAAAGTVKAAEPNGGYGKWVLIEHAPGLATAYAHLESFAPHIVPGARVAQGDIIGFTGDTGTSTGPHLHYEVVVNGEAVDPMSHAASARDSLRGADLARFHALFSDLLRDYAGTAPLARASIR